MYRIVSVDDIGTPLTEEKLMVEKKIKDLFITVATKKDTTPATDGKATVSVSY